MTKKTGKIQMPDENEIAQFGGQATAGEAAPDDRSGDDSAGAADNGQSDEAADQPPAELDDYKDKYLRAKAELQNVTRRVRNEQAETVRFANVSLVRALLVVLDDLDRIIESDHHVDDVATVLDGLKLVQQNFQKVLGEISVEPIDTADVPFDPVVHEAMMQQPSQEHPAGTVLRVVQKGYRLGDRVIRAAKVIVSAGSTSPEGAAEVDAEVGEPNTDASAEESRT